METLDIKNIIEVSQIKKILTPYPKLLNMFETLIILSNNRLNVEKAVFNLPIEPYEEPDLSDHESDDDDLPNPADDY